jgi:tRNA A-37 threonylcarbamoyl transferase component Bud32
MNLLEELRQARGGADAGAPLSHLRHADIEVPQKIGRFQVLDLLGFGGQGIVFLAHDPKLRRSVALKMPRPEVVASQQRWARFRREAKTVARLSHKNIVAVHEVVSTRAGRVIVCEFCDGPSLSDLLEEHARPITPRQAAELIALVADAVAYAHERGVLHRDLKPTNIFLAAADAADPESVTWTGPGGHRWIPKLGDFGLAKLTAVDSADTQSGTIVGTACYMSPEQAEGKVHAVTTRTDVYGLGVCLYEILTERRPVQGENDPDTLRRIPFEEPLHPQRVNRRTPADLAAICMKCLEKDPRHRYAGAAALAVDLRRFLAGESTLARPVGLPVRAYRWLRRRPAVLGLACLGIAAALIVSLILFRSAALAREQQMKSDVQLLLSCRDRSIGEHVRIVAAHGPAVRPLVERALSLLPPESDGRLRAALAAFAVDGSRVEEIRSRLLKAGPDEAAEICDVVQVRRESFSGWLLSAATNASAPEEARFRAACALAALASGAEPWDVLAPRITYMLVQRPPVEMNGWSELLRPMRGYLLGPLRSIYLNSLDEQSARGAAAALARLEDDGAELVNLAKDAKEHQLEYLVSRLREDGDVAIALIRQTLSASPALAVDQQSNAAGNEPASDQEADAKAIAILQSARLAAALAALDRIDRAVGWIERRPNEGLVCAFVHYLRPATVRMDEVRLAFLSTEASDPRQAVREVILIRALAEFPQSDLSVEDRRDLQGCLLQLYTQSPHVGAHAAAEWALRNWLGITVAPATPNAMPSASDRNWYAGPNGHTLIILSAGEGEPTPPRFAIASAEVTVGQFRKFDPDWGAGSTAEDSWPVVEVTPENAARYCNWLSREAGIPEDQWCYHERVDDQGKPILEAAPNGTELAGFRLPTLLEWEHSCEPTAETLALLRRSELILEKLAWYSKNSRWRPNDAFALQPNLKGVYGGIGNASELCWDPSQTGAGHQGISYVGSSFTFPLFHIRPRPSLTLSQSGRSITLGFRVGQSSPD